MKSTKMSRKRRTLIGLLLWLISLKISIFSISFSNVLCKLWLVGRAAIGPFNFQSFPANFDTTKAFRQDINITCMSFVPKPCVILHFQQFYSKCGILGCLILLVFTIYTHGHNVPHSWFSEKHFNSFDSLPIGIDKQMISLKKALVKFFENQE